MRIARVTGVLTISRKLPELASGRYLITEALDQQALWGMKDRLPRKTSMPESLVVFDELGAGIGQIIAVSEGREAAQPFGKRRVPIDAYCAAILDDVNLVIREN